MAGHWATPPRDGASWLYPHHILPGGAAGPGAGVGPAAAGGGGRGACRELVRFTPARRGEDQQRRFRPQGFCLCCRGGYSWNWPGKGSQSQ